MSWLEGLGELGASLAGGATGARAYARGAVMSAAARAGASGASVLGQLRGLGIGVRTGDFYQSWNALRSQVASGQTASSIPLGVASGAPLQGTAPEGWQGQYTHEVTGIIRERTPEGGYSLRSVTRYLNSSNILSPESAAGAMVDMLMTPGERGQQYLAQVSDLLTVSLSGLWYRTNALRGI